MCRAVSYQYDCGASFHKIFPCEQRCFTCIAPENLLQPANAAPRSANATNANGDTPATNPAGTASTSAAATNTVSDANSRADNADSVNSSDSNTTIKPPEPNTTTTNNTATTAASSTPSQHASNRSSTHAPAPTSAPPPSTSTITPAHAHRIARACYDRAAAAAPAPTLWTRLRRQLRRRSARARRTDESDEAVLALGPDNAGAMARFVTERRVVRVAGRCPACEGRGGREEAWAVVATFLGED